MAAGVFVRAEGMRRDARDRARQMRRGGFTLVEVIVSLAVLAMTVLVISRAFLTLLGVARGSGEHTLAGALAVRVLEETRSLPEAQATAEGWADAVDRLTGHGATAFPSPYSRYDYEITTDRVDLAPLDQHPCWLTTDPPAPCAPGDVHSNSMKWITVRVSREGRTLARVGSAVVRGMHRTQGGQGP